MDVIRVHRRPISVQLKYSQFCYYVCSSTHVSYNATDECVTAVCITRSLTYASWLLLRDLSDQCEVPPQTQHQ
jgi:hypothetical protein